MGTFIKYYKFATKYNIALRILQYRYPQILFNTINLVKLFRYLYMKQNQQKQQPLVIKLKKTTSQNDQYQDMGVLGKGAFGKVSLAKKNGKLYAHKQIEKKKLARECKQYQAFIQKQLLKNINHPGIIKMVKCFQDKRNLNFILEYCHGGDFTTFMRFNNKYFTEQLRVFYVAQIVTILEYLHTSGITHRDLKPQNIMLSKDGHLKLIDFGTAQISRCKIVDEKFKEDMQKHKKNIAPNKLFPEDSTEGDIPQQQEEMMSPTRKRKSTFVGTCFYLSPQLLEHNICEPPSDLWALGCIIYQLYYLQPPFKAPVEYQLFEKIKNLQISFPKNQCITDDAIDLIKKLLVKVPQDRLGSNSRQGLMFSDLKAHPYFKNVKFQNIFSQNVPPLTQQKIQKQQHQHKLEKYKAQIQGDHQQILADKESILENGIVQKKTFSSYFACYLILKKDLQLYKINLHESNQRKIDITPLSPDTIAELIDETKFKTILDEVPTTIRTLNAAKWVEILNAEYKKYKESSAN